MTVASLIADLVLAGLDPMLIGRVAEALSQREAVLVPDENADRRRERDRDRKRVRRIPQMSADSADPLSETKVSPTPPSKTQPITIPPSPPMGAHGSTADSFSAFWSAFPRKEAKPKAKAAYDRALKRIGGPDPPGGILVALNRAKLCRQWREGIIPHPATWLNRDPWDDEPTENERPDQSHTTHDQTDPRRANTESRRRAWSEIIAEHDGVPFGGDAGPERSRNDQADVPNYPRLAHTSDGG